MGIKNVFIVQAAASFIFVMQINKKINFLPGERAFAGFFCWPILPVVKKRASLKLIQSYRKIKQGSNYASHATIYPLPGEDISSPSRTASGTAKPIQLSE
jgi:hypothetical protein